MVIEALCVVVNLTMVAPQTVLPLGRTIQEMGNLYACQE